MKRKWMAITMLAGGLETAAFAQQQYPPQYQQQYPQQSAPYQGNPNDYPQQYGNGQYPNNGQYAADPGYGQNHGDPAYNGNSEGGFGFEMIVGCTQCHADCDCGTL